MATLAHVFSVIALALAGAALFGPLSLAFVSLFFVTLAIFANVLSMQPSKKVKHPLPKGYLDRALEKQNTFFK